MSKTMEVKVVSAEEAIFLGKATFIAVPGEFGEIGVYPGHTQLITNLKLGGEVRITQEDGSIDSIFVRGGMVEVLPDQVTVLADTATRSENLDAAKLEIAKQQAEQSIAKAKSKVELAKAKAELANMISELKIVEKLKKLKQ